MVCAAVVGLALAVIVAWGVWSSRQHQLRDKQAATYDLAQALGHHAYATVKQADIVLFGLVERIEKEGMGPVALKRLQMLLRNQRVQLPQLHGLFIYDSQGRWLVNSNLSGPVGANNSDREYFVYHRDHADADTYIGPPIRSRSTGTWILTVSRRINHPDGSFAGVALATIDLHYFLRLYETLDIGKNGVVNLVLGDGTILIRRPFQDKDIGVNVAGGPLFSQYLKKSSQGVAIFRSVVDNIQRIVGFTRVDEYPLVVFVARDKREVLAEWRKESLITASIVVFFALLLAYLGHRLMMLMRHQLSVEQQLRQAQESLVQANKSLDMLAREDGLTGLANRREFDSAIQNEFDRARRNARSVGLLMLDVDFFKAYNDHYGHQGGDDGLRTVSRLIKEHTNRQTDLAARYGGEEFVVLLPDTDREGSGIVAEKLRAAVQQECIAHALAPLGMLTVSIGVAALVPGRDDAPARLIAMADKALYEAKNRGRNQSFSF